MKKMSITLKSNFTVQSVKELLSYSFLSTINILANAKIHIHSNSAVFPDVTLELQYILDFLPRKKRETEHLSSDACCKGRMNVQSSYGRIADAQRNMKLLLFLSKLIEMN